MARLLGVILAGGQARRFGSDKALALLDGRALIDHVAAALAPHVDAVAVSGRTAAIDALPAIADWPSPGLGPLGGLCGALRYAADAGYDAVVSAGCDTPVLRPALIARLAGAVGAAQVDRSPVLGRWPVALAAPLARHLAGGGDRSVRRWAESVGAERLDAGYDIPNLNAVTDLVALARGDGAA